MRFQNAGAISIVLEEQRRPPYLFSFRLCVVIGDMLQKPTCLDRKRIYTHKHFTQSKWEASQVPLVRNFSHSTVNVNPSSGSTMMFGRLSRLSSTFRSCTNSAAHGCKSILHRAQKGVTCSFLPLFFIQIKYPPQQDLGYNPNFSITVECGISQVLIGC